VFTAQAKPQHFIHQLFQFFLEARV